jgi:hypothetical protein
MLNDIMFALARMLGMLSKTHLHDQLAVSCFQTAFCAGSQEALLLVTQVLMNQTTCKQHFHTAF